MDSRRVFEIEQKKSIFFYDLSLNRVNESVRKRKSFKSLVVDSKVGGGPGFSDKCVADTGSFFSVIHQGRIGGKTPRFELIENR